MNQQSERLYGAIEQAVETRAAQLWQVATALHRDPETAYEEFRAVALLTGALGGDGFQVEQGVADMPTAFVARTGTGAGPTVALLLEYDALPQPVSHSP